MSKVGKQLIHGLRWFLRKLKSGKPINVTRVECHETPDGPMHTFTKVKAKGKR